MIPYHPEKERALDDLEQRLIEQGVYIDEAYFGEWVAFGMDECEAYLRRYANFERYIEELDS